MGKTEEKTIVIYNKNRDKKEQGAITLFVLLACLFFVFILMGVYVSNLNKLQVQEQEIKQIQENYAKEIEIVDEIYENIATGVKVSLSQNPEKGIWCQEVTLTGIGKVEENIKIAGYTFSENSKDETNLTWTSVSDLSEITIDKKVIENGTYYFWVKDNKGGIYRSNKVEVSNIDRIAPIPGSIIAKELDKNGNETGEYDISKSTWTDKSVRIEKVDGADNESGQKKTTYTVVKDGLTIGTDITDFTVLDNTGIYDITVKTEDNAGNIATSKIYTVKIDKVVPILSLKHNGENGENYEQGTWTKDDLYGKITIDTDKTVEKYQYSYNGIIWNNISANPATKPIDYTTTFPIREDAPKWFSGPKSNGEYYFEVQDDGSLGSNNSWLDYTTASSYFEIDLTDYPAEASLDITVNATIVSEEYYDVGYIAISTDTVIPDEYFAEVSGDYITDDYTTTITGGQKYYLHIWYSKDESYDVELDQFIINSIKLKNNVLESEMNFAEYAKINNNVTFKLKEGMDKEIYLRAIYENEAEASRVSGSTSIKIDKTSPIIVKINSAIKSNTEAYFNVKVKEEESGIRGYYISTENTAPTESSEWIEELSKEFTTKIVSNNNTYYIWVIDKVGNISEKYEITPGTGNYVVDDMIYTETLADAIEYARDGSKIKLLNNYVDKSTVAFDKNVTLDIQNYILTRSETITVNSGKTVEITGTGKITTEENPVNTIINNGTLALTNNITIENMSTSVTCAPIYTNNSVSVTNVNDNVNIIGYYRGIHNNLGTVNINGGYIEATCLTSSAYGLYNSASYSKVYINYGVIKGYYGVYNYDSNALIEMTGGKVVGTGAYGIYATGTTNIYGGRVEGKTYGIYGYTNDTITIGKQEEELSTTNPAIYGASYGIYMKDTTYSFNFYNGVIISNLENTEYNSKVNLRDSHITYTYLDYEVEQKYCTILVPKVENIEIESTPTEYTNGDVTVKIKYPYVETRQYSEDKNNWIDTKDYIQEIIVTENKTIYARAINDSGVIIDEEQIVINNIDKEKPSVSVTPEQTSYIVTDTNNTIDLTVVITASDTGVSGLDVMQYGWAKDGETPTYVDFNNTITVNKNGLGIGQYNLYFNVTDKAGNKSDLVQMRYIVKYEEPVCKIGSTTYLTIQEAVNACSKSAGTTQTTITMLKNSNEEFTTYAGQNIILDLAGHTIGSSSQTTPLCINNSTIQIIDSSTAKTGKLESINGTAILNNSTLTIGDNSTSIEMESPTIYGRKIGIKNNGTFNFYDGKIQGIAPIQGNINTTPDSYGPVSTDYAEGITTIQLGIVTGYEARIDWVYYTTVQNAVDATRINKIDTVTIIKDIELQTPLMIQTVKNMILDLDGYKIIANSEQDRVIENNGKIEITDSSKSETGEISIETKNLCYVIYNTGNLTISKGNIRGTTNVSSKNRHCYGIYNKNTGNITVNGGNITVQTITNSKSVTNTSYGIYSLSEGNIEITGGIIDSSSSYTSYGIYNEGVGNLNIKGGKVNSSSITNSYGNYGIYNGSKGDITISGGELNSSSTEYSNSTCTGYIIYNAGTGNITISDGTLSGDSTTTLYGIYNENTGDVTISGSKLIVGGFSGIGIHNENDGNIIMTEGNIECNVRGSSTGICNKTTGNVTITGGTIKSIGGSTNEKKVIGIDNKGTGNIIITGGTITSECDINAERNTGYGIYNESMGTVIIEAGTVTSTNDSSGKKSSSYGIYNLNLGKIVIGSAETDISQQPVISDNSDGYSVYNPKGIVELYNGIIQGNQDVFAANITKIRDGYVTKTGTINSKPTLYLELKNNLTYIVQVDQTKYYSLQTAIDSIGENENKTIKVLTNFEIDEDIEFNKTITLDLNSYTIVNKYYSISNSGNLTITDTSGKSTGTLDYSKALYGIINKENGNIEMTAGTITNSSTAKGKSYGLYNLGPGNIKITKGIINNISAGYSYGIYNASAGRIELGEATVSSENIADNESYGIYNENAGTIEIISASINSNGGTSGDTYGIFNLKSGTILMTGGSITTINNSLYDCSGVANFGGNVIIGGSITVTNQDHGDVYGIYNDDGDVSVIGGTIISSSEEGSAYGISSGGSTSKVIVKDAIIKSDGNASTYGISNGRRGTVQVISGTITATGAGDVNCGVSNPTKATMAGTITIGEKDGLVSTSSLSITGQYTGTLSSCVGYGIKNTAGKLYFYDGIIQGSTKAVYDIITEIEDNTELDYNNDETILKLTTQSNDVAQIGSTTYSTIQKAINAAGTSKTTIKILRNVAYTSNDSVITIPNTKNIVLDLNGYKITSTTTAKAIQNEGMLEITDTSTSKTGTILTTEETTVNNVSGAKLIITSGIIDNRSKQPIFNQGELVINGGTINANGNVTRYGIYNSGSGAISITGGTIKAIQSSEAGYKTSSYGIYSNSTGNITITGGNITANTAYYSYGIRATGHITISGGNITSSSKAHGCYGVYNESTMTMTGGKIQCNSTAGVEHMSYGIYGKTVTITAGTVTGRDYGIYNSETVIGTKGDNSISTSSPYINGKYGIYSSRTLCFYDGKIGGTIKAIPENITELEENTEMLVSQSSSNEILTLQQKTTSVASLNGTEYDSIKEAIEAAGTTANTIKILRDADPGTTITIGSDQYITIDLNGYTVKNYHEISNKGTLKITDTSAEQTGKMIGLTGIAIKNIGTMELNGGSIIDSAYGIDNKGTLTINGGIITNNTYAIYNTGTLNVEEGTITSNTYGIYHYGGTSNINGGTLTSNEYGVYNSKGRIDIKSTGISNNSYGIYQAKGTTNIKEGTEIQSNTGIFVAEGILNIGETGTMNSVSPIIIGETYGLSVGKAATVYMYDGQIKGKTGATQGYITYTESGYTVANKTEGEYNIDYLALAGTISTVAEVNGIDFSNLQSAINSVTGEETQTIKLTNGIITTSTFTIAEGQNIILDMNGKTITSSAAVTINNAGNLTIIDSSGNDVAKISNTLETAIVNSGTLTLGENDGTVNQELITIDGTTYGIENSGTLNFYDGTINGTSALSGTITNRATGYLIRTTTVDGKERYYLSVS